MAKTKEPLNDTSTKKIAKRVSRTGEGLTPLAEGQEIRGIFAAVKVVTIKDRRTKAPKEIRVYSIRLNANGEMARIGSRRMLDDAFDELGSEYGGIHGLVGKEMSIIRGSDVETADANPMGTYELIVWE